MAHYKASTNKKTRKTNAMDYDILLTIGITISITIITVVMDYVAAKMVTLSRLGNKVLEIDAKDYSEAQFKEFKENVKQTANYFKTSKLERNVWGNELAVVALSLDFTAVGLWISNPTIYNFFSHFNATDTDRSVMFCFFMILIHLIIFLFSLIFKNQHLEKVKDQDEDSIPDFFSKAGFGLNQWKYYNNALGFISLTSSILIYTLIS